MRTGLFLALLLVAAVSLSGCFLFPEAPREGSSFENAIVIQSDNEEEGIAMEYDYLYDNACLENDGGKEVEMQELQDNEGSLYDILHVICNNGEKELYYFNIDSFFGKWE